MDKKRLYSIGALFGHANEITRAVKETVAAGYTKYDVNTPFPVHGMEKAMKLKPSPVGFITLFFGLSGALFAFLFMTWVTGDNYPLIIGGKPFFTWPAFVPIAFEVTVLLSAISTVAGMLFVMFRFPNTSHPIHGTEYMRKVSRDSFGINILASDPKFNEKEITAFLQKLGGSDIESIYEDLSGREVRMFEPKFIGFLVIVMLITAGSSYFVLNHLLFMHPFDWMWVQPKVLPQSKSTFFTDGYSMRMPVEGTVARGFIPYEYKGMPDSLVKMLSNPLFTDSSVVARGKKKYDIYCSPCHGYYGKGDSRLKGQFPNPPTLHSDKVRNWGDGNIYNVITNGQNVMPGYESSIPREDRWAIIKYIRVLERSQNALDTDIEGK